MGPQLVLLVQKDEQIGTDEWFNLNSEIEGFDYTQGYVYDLEVRITQNRNPSQDGGSLDYKLINIIQKQKVPTSTLFSLNLKSLDENFVTENLENGFKILETLKIDCVELCSELSKSLDTNEIFSGEFVHSGENELTLIKID